MRSPFSGHAERMEAFSSSLLYPVISSEFCSGRSVEDVLLTLAQKGAKIVQLREKKRGGRELFEIACACREICTAYRMLLIIDDHVDIALACDADGVHLGQDDLPVAEARKIAPQLIIGTSTHNAAEISSAVSFGCSYLNIGPIFPTATKSVACGALGLETLKNLIPMTTVPFTVMGGIKKHHIPELLSIGAKHIAMVTGVIDDPDILLEYAVHAE